MKKLSVRRFSCLILLLLTISTASAQNLTLSDLLRFRTMDLNEVRQEMLHRHWKEARQGFALTSGGPDGRAIARLIFYNVRGKPHEHDLWLLTYDVHRFNQFIRDSLEAYGWVPDMDYDLRQSDVMVTKRRWKSTDPAEHRTIRIRYRDKLSGETARIEIFE